MYEDHFGFSGRPFQLTPDPAFWFETATHRKAMAYLGYGLAQGEGFIVVTGDIGAGKTTLVGHLMEEIDPAIMTPIRLVSTQIEPDDLLRIVAAGLGVEPAGKSKADLLSSIERALHGVARTGRRTLLVVDEVQALPTGTLEELRMLSNFQAGGHALLQILLLGQPEFRERLHGSDRLEQLRQRVIAVHHLDPMGVDEVMPYVAHRLALVGWAGRPDFADDAFPALHRASGGVPRRLNQLASRILLHCAVEGVDMIDARVVRQVAEDGARDLRVATPAPTVTAPNPAPAATWRATASAANLAAATPPAATVAAPAEATPEPAPVAPAAPARAVRLPILPPVAAPAPAAEDVPPPVPAPVDTPPAAPVQEATPAPEQPAPRRPIAPVLAAATDLPPTRPMTPSPAVAGARPIRLAAVDAEPAPIKATPPPPVEPVTPTVEPAMHMVEAVAAPEPPAATPPVAEPEPQPEPAPTDADRLAALEARVDEQDAALRRVLTLLIDWAEGDGRLDAAALRGAA